MKIESEVSGNNLEIKLDGRLDTSSLTELEQCLNTNLTANITSVVFDFEKLLYVSSSGLRLLLMTQKKMNQIDGSLEIKNVNDFVMDILNSVGFSDIIAIKQY